MIASVDDRRDDDSNSLLSIRCRLDQLTRWRGIEQIFDWGVNFDELFRIEKRTSCFDERSTFDGDALTHILLQPRRFVAFQHIVVQREQIPIHLCRGELIHSASYATVLELLREHFRWRNFRSRLNFHWRRRFVLDGGELQRLRACHL